MADIDNPITIYSVQRTYIIKSAVMHGGDFLTCDQRIDIPTIEPLTEIGAGIYGTLHATVVPCIELAGDFLGYFDFTFETNEGVTVLPVKIDPASLDYPSENPYLYPRYVLVLPRGATGVKSCKVIHKAFGLEAPNDLTFGIMPPPYNYDNALFGYLAYNVGRNRRGINTLDREVTNLKARVTALENKAGG